LSSEEQKHTPDPQDDRKRGTEGSSEPVKETQRGTPEDPASPERPDEDPDTAEKPKGIPDVDALAGEEEPGAAEDELAALAEELELTRRERDEYLDALRRLKAELENLRKRQEKERARLMQMASERLVRDLLPVLDNLERALEAGGDIREGVRATHEQLVTVLGREGLAPVFSDGKTFDPEVHEAVMSQPSEEHEDGAILQTFERGYLLNGKTIRPAKVVVAKQV
jgi:molecular chaperone GrpE